MSIFSLITIREGSKGLKNKCLQKICGRYVFEYTVDYSLGLSKNIEGLFTVVSSDSRTVEDYCLKYGINFIKRPPELAVDYAKIEDVIYDAHKKVDREFDYISLLYGNIPVRYPEEFLKAYNFLLNNSDYDCVLSMQNVEKYNPAWMHKLRGDCLPLKENKGYRRQDLKQFMIHDGHTVLFRSKKFLEFKGRSLKDDVMHGVFGEKIKPMLNDKLIVDIDTERDLLLAEAVVEFRKNKSKN
ncbi:MAG: hypothetical protein GF375_05260 [Candidatus Omnitrophica bacterium]|nr:hypothetical protein [Candidatus Omnitrophota bacterium]MBD3269397.1 hypothetical protein [Candidatus Omnitrophota bacterium]